VGAFLNKIVTAGIKKCREIFEPGVAAEGWTADAYNRAVFGILQPAAAALDVHEALGRRRPMHFCHERRASTACPTDIGYSRLFMAGRCHRHTGCLRPRPSLSQNIMAACVLAFVRPNNCGKALRSAKRPRQAGQRIGEFNAYATDHLQAKVRNPF